jgi:hypothetical protein
LRSRRHAIGGQRLLPKTKSLGVEALSSLPPIEKYDATVRIIRRRQGSKNAAKRAEMAADAV